METTLVLVCRGGRGGATVVVVLAVLGKVKRGLTPFYIIRGVGLGLLLG